MRARSLLFAAGLLFGLSGCYQDADVVLHEPGVYKGAVDPLMGKPARDRESSLSERFSQIQIDR